MAILFSPKETHRQKAKNDRMGGEESDPYYSLRIVPVAGASRR
jgi:hypothetical protein